MKQYRKYFGFEDVELEFTEDALSAVADLALDRQTGARGLRSILEEVLLEVMYDLPSIEEPVKVVINAGVVKGKSKAKISPLDTGKKRDAA